MWKKAVSIVNLVFWILLLLSFIFADNLGLSISYQSMPVHYGRYQIPAIIAAAIAVIVAVIGVVGGKSDSTD